MASASPAGTWNPFLPSWTFSGIESNRRGDDRFLAGHALQQRDGGSPPCANLGPSRRLAKAPREHPGASPGKRTASPIFHFSASDSSLGRSSPSPMTRNLSVGTTLQDDPRRVQKEGVVFFGSKGREDRRDRCLFVELKLFAERLARPARVELLDVHTVGDPRRSLSGGHPSCLRKIACMRFGDGHKSVGNRSQEAVQEFDVVGNTGSNELPMSAPEPRPSLPARRPQNILSPPVPTVTTASISRDRVHQPGQFG